MLVVGKVQVTQPSWILTEGNGSLVAVALHDGHDIGAEVSPLLAVSESDRTREEDPFTAMWTTVADTQIVVKRSRFEFDLNRPREQAVYLSLEDSWGLSIWHTLPSEEIVARSLAEYDAFYATVQRVFADLEQRFGRFVVFDLHTYNHRREGLEALPADPDYNPEINLGTGSLNRELWGCVVERFVNDLRSFDFLGRQLDVRENNRFTGGHFSRWTHQMFPEPACVLAIEVKKFFMNEWSNEADSIQLEAIHLALQSTVLGVLEVLKQVS